MTTLTHDDFEALLLLFGFRQSMAPKHAWHLEVVNEFGRPTWPISVFINTDRGVDYIEQLLQDEVLMTSFSTYEEAADHMKRSLKTLGVLNDP